MLAINMEKTAAKLKARRQELGYSVSYASGVLRLATSYAVYKWEYGINLPSIDNLINLAVLYQCQPMDLIVTDKVDI